MASLLQITQASKHYGDQVLLDEAEATIPDNVKMGFIGRNGAGKSTLLRILLGEEELDSGEVIRSSSLRLGYLRQHDPFLPDETALAFLMRDSGQPDWKCGEVAGDFELKGADLEFQREKRIHEERSNETILAKRRHLEEFIAKNKARAATATLARSKSKQLERLELTAIARDQPTARIRAPRVEPRKGPALRCRDLAIGYPERPIAAGL